MKDFLNEPLLCSVSDLLINSIVQANEDIIDASNDDLPTGLSNISPIFSQSQGSHGEVIVANGN